MPPTTHNILSWTPTPFDTLANQRNGPDIIQARQRIQGYWRHNKFYNYTYTPSLAYHKKYFKYKKLKQRKWNNLKSVAGLNV